MKKITLLFLLLPFLGLSQVQIGQDIDGQAANDFSGSGVSISENGNIVAVGAPKNDDNGNNSGHVRVYENIGGIWTQIGQDINGDEPNVDFGWKTSISNDGNILAVSALGDIGYVKIYEIIGDTWTQIGQKIVGENPSDAFAESISLSSNGTTIAIGASNHGAGGSVAGRVKIFRNIGNVWTQIGQNLDGVADEAAGESVSLSADGNIVAVGTGPYSSYVKVYENIEDVWIQIGEDIEGISNLDENFGEVVSLSANGNILAVGSRFSDVNGYSSGAVLIYENVEGTWIQIGQRINGVNISDWFGSAVSLSSDGTLIATGAQSNSDEFDYSGQVKIYKNIEGSWIQIGQNINGEGELDQCGEPETISISSDGNTVAIGARMNDGINGSNSGHVRVFDLSNALSIYEFKDSIFKLYPNPTKNQFTIQLDASVQLKNIKIYNILGQAVLISEEKIINTSNLSSGSYIVEILTNKGKSSKKLIIQ